MKVDQKWVEDNIDDIAKIFNRINRTESSGNKSNHKKKMKENMDKVIYRGYYELARKQEKEKVNKAKTIGDKEQRIRMDEIIECNTSNTKNAIDILEEQLDINVQIINQKEKIIKVMGNQMTEQNKQIASYMKQMEEKDKQIENLLQIINQKLSLSSLS